jgi:hypothetical protein
VDFPIRSGNISYIFGLPATPLKIEGVVNGARECTRPAFLDPVRQFLHLDLRCSVAGAKKYIIHSKISRASMRGIYGAID